MEIHRINGVMAYAYLIETATGLFLIDAGIEGTGRKVLRLIAKLGRKPDELLATFITHAHADHFGGLGEVQEATGCEVFCHPAHRDTLRSGAGLVSPGLNFFGRSYEKVARVLLPKLTLPKIARVRSLADGEALHTLGLPGRVLHTPGHSRGDLTVVLDQGAAFVGDLVQGPRIPRLSPPEFSIMAVDEQGMLASWKKLLESGAKTLYPGHGSILPSEQIKPLWRRKGLPRLQSR